MRVDYVCRDVSRSLLSTVFDPVYVLHSCPYVCARRRVDTLLAIWILLILACGVHGMLWQAALIQHWIKSSGCDQVRHYLCSVYVACQTAACFRE